jgi:hypothetical protein
VRVSEATETIRPVGRVEKFQMMAQKNQASYEMCRMLAPMLEDTDLPFI